MDARYNNNFLYFDEGPHKYTDSLNNEYRSVTTLIGDYYPHFDADYWAHKKAKEQGKSEKAIRAEWERIKNEACERGTKTHNGLEDAIKEVSKFKTSIDIKFLQFQNKNSIFLTDDVFMFPKLIFSRFVH